MSNRLLREADIITAILESKEMFWTNKDIQRFAVIVGDIPAVDVELNFKLAYERGKENRPQGKWIKDNLGTVICSECKRPRRDSRVGHTNFCNSCGARMLAKDINVPNKKGVDDE